MGILDSTLRQQCSSLLWFALPPSSPVSQRPSLRLRLILPCSTEPMAMVPILTPTLVSTTTDMPDMPDTPMPLMASTMARGPLMPSPPPLPSPMLMPTMATTVMAPGPTTDWDTEDTDWDTEATTGDKFSAFEVQSRSSKRTSL